MIKSRAPGTPLVLTVTQDSVTDASDDAEEEANPSGGATAAAPTASKVCTHLPCRVGFVGALSVSALVCFFDSWRTSVRCGGLHFPLNHADRGVLTAC